MNNQCLRLTGSGGQGVILASVILAEAAVIAGKYTAQSQSYGPEARGSLCSSETIISSGAILFPKIEHPDILVLLTQEACDIYSAVAGSKCTILTDSSLSVTGAARVISLPIFSAAEKTCGKSNCVNMLTVGAINRLCHIVPETVLSLAVKRHLPQTSWESSIAACMTGAELAGSAKLD